MRTAAMIDYPAQGLVRVIVNHDNPMSHREAAEKMRSVLTSTQIKLVDACAKAGSPISRDELGERSGYSAASGNFQNVVGSLCTVGVFTRPAAGMLALSEWAAELLF